MAAPIPSPGPRAQPVPANALDRIKHIVVLMLENRSFDCMLGRLYPKSDAFDGLDGTESNLDLDGNLVRVNNQPGTDAAVLSRPDPNPGENWLDINEQLFGSREPPAPGQIPAMNGFVRNYLRQTRKPAAAYQAAHVMHGFTPDQVPVLSGLAKAFGVSDRWFASAPCQTWPNRFFATTGTANGYENNLPLYFPYMMPNIFDRLHAMDPANGWRVYFHEIAHAQALTRLWRPRRRFARIGRFFEDAQAGTLPSYSYIEPRYLTVLQAENDAHPPSNIAMGEQLLADVYNALRQGPAWTETLLVVVFDEHGGCYDHVPPPAAVPPSTEPTWPFNFDRYGVRVPAVIVSPFVPAGRILRPPGATPFDHTSILATLRRRFDLGPPLSARDAAAPDLGFALSLPEPTNLGPERIEPLAAEAGAARSAAARADEDGLTDLQRALEGLSESLPAADADIEAHVRGLRAGGPRPARSTPASPRTVGIAVDARVRRFMGDQTPPDGSTR